MNTEKTLNDAAQAARPDTETGAMSNEIIAEIKELIKAGNISSIRVRKDNRVIVNIPMTSSVVGTVPGAVAAPWTVLVIAFAAFGINCTVEVEDKDGKVTIIHGKA